MGFLERGQLAMGQPNPRTTLTRRGALQSRDCCSGRCVGEAAARTLARLPARRERDVDAVTVHNEALYQLAERHPAAAADRLHYLLADPVSRTACPAETFRNLLLIYARHEVRCARGRRNAP